MLKYIRLLSVGSDGAKIRIGNQIPLLIHPSDLMIILVTEIFSTRNWNKYQPKSRK